MTIARITPLFVDLEASGLGANSWPVEIGVASLDGDAIELRASLIRPHQEWPDLAWSPVSAGAHGVPRAALDAAPPADGVAQDCAARLTVLVQPRDRHVKRAAA